MELTIDGKKEKGSKVNLITTQYKTQRTNNIKAKLTNMFYLCVDCVEKEREQSISLYVSEYKMLAQN